MVYLVWQSETAYFQLMEEVLATSIKHKTEFDRLYSVFPFIWFCRLFMETLTRVVRFKNRTNTNNSWFLSEWIEYILLIMFILYFVYTIDQLNTAEVMEQQKYLLHDSHSLSAIQNLSEFADLSVKTQISFCTDYQNIRTASALQMDNDYPSNALFTISEHGNKNSHRNLIANETTKNLIDFTANIRSHVNQNEKFEAKQCQQIVHQMAIQIQFEQSHESNPTIWHMFQINQGMMMHFMGLLIPFTIMCIPFLPSA